ncbi:MAG: GNAT family N-acetyltransferase [Anaerolineae bacterium]|nr:GNAT family N-acetyltransferase [Anaerolineae bacterium]
MATTRLATLEDVPVLAQLLLEVQELHVVNRPDIFKPADDVAAFETDFRERMLGDSEGWVFLAEEANSAVGYAYATLVQRPESVYGFAPRYIHIDQISVKSTFRGRGCGQALVEAVFAMARSQGVNRVTLSTWAFNSDAHGFFEKMGFQPYLFSMETTLE